MKKGILIFILVVDNQCIECFNGLNKKFGTDFSIH